MTTRKRDASHRNYDIQIRSGYIGGKRVFILLKMNDQVIEADVSTLSTIYSVPRKVLSTRIYANFSFEELIEPQKKFKVSRSRSNCMGKPVVTPIYALQKPQLSTQSRLIRSLPTRDQLSSGGAV